MKIRFECTRCSREWSSAYGNTQWYYKLDVRRGPRGGISSCTLSFKVHTYYQKCERCNAAGKINPYDDEYDRLAKVFCNGLANDMGLPPRFTNTGNQRPSPNMKRAH